MKKHAYFIGIDNGGSAIKAAVFDENGRELSVMLSERRRFVPRTLKAFQSAGMAEVLDS